MTHPYTRLIAFTFLLSVAVAGLGQPGSVDLTFDPGSGFGGSVRDLFVRPDGRVIVTGSFDTYNDVPFGGIVGVNTDGSIDQTFNSGIGFPDQTTVWRIIEQPGGKLLCLGNFASYNGHISQGIVRLNMDGAVDTTFNPGSGITNGTAYDLAVQADGKIILAGDLFQYDGSATNNFHRLLPDGGLDPSWDAPFITGWGIDVEVCPDSILTFAATSELGRLRPNGFIDNIFEATIGDGPNSQTQVVHMLPDCKAYIGGWFTEYDGHPVGHLARINYDGTFDSSFDTGTGANNYVMDFEVQADGKVLVMGYFNTFNDVTSWKLVRVLSDGTLDPTFSVGQGPFQYNLDRIALLPDGKIMVIGGFATFNNIPRSKIVRLNNDDVTEGLADHASTPSPLPFTTQANGDVTLLGQDQGMRQVQVLDMNGKVMLTTTTSGLVPTGRLAPGVYVLSVLDPVRDLVQRAKMVRE